MAEALAKISQIHDLGMIQIRADLARAGDAIAGAAGLAIPGAGSTVGDGSRLLGWMSPDGDADFSVAIRTLSVTGDQIVMNVGGGLTHGSTVDGEWEEALWKARFVKAAVSRD